MNDTPQDPNPIIVTRVKCLCGNNMPLDERERGTCKHCGALIEIERRGQELDVIWFAKSTQHMIQLPEITGWETKQP